MFASLISPKPGLILIRKKIEETLKKPVPVFSLMYITKTDKLQFIIEKECFLYESDMLKSVVNMTAKKQLKKGQIMDVIQININEKNEIDAKLYFTEGTEKKFTNINL
jgi:hypothetical protein